jgi:hypothetical protein
MQLTLCEMHKYAHEIWKSSGSFALELESEKMSLGQNFMWLCAIFMVMGIVQEVAPILKTACHSLQWFLRSVEQFPI